MKNNFLRILTVLVYFTSFSFFSMVSTQAIQCGTSETPFLKNTNSDYAGNTSGWTGSINISINVIVEGCTSVNKGNKVLKKTSITTTPTVNATSNNPVESVSTSYSKPITRSIKQDCAISNGSLVYNKSLISAIKKSDPKTVMSCVLYTTSMVAKVSVKAKSVGVKDIKIGGGNKGSYSFSTTLTTLVAPTGDIYTSLI